MIIFAHMSSFSFSWAPFVYVKYRPAVVFQWYEIQLRIMEHSELQQIRYRYLFPMLIVRVSEPTCFGAASAPGIFLSGAGSGSW